MTPSKLDITIHRGTSFELELVSQIKSFVFDPDIHNSLADRKRTHAKNLEHYGFTYEYIDFASVYNNVELIVDKSWAKAGDNAKPIMVLSSLDDDLELTDKSVKIGISFEDTQKIEFDTGKYKLSLTSGVYPDEKIDNLIYGEITILGKK